MKLKAINEISKLESENAIEKILKHLSELSDKNFMEIENLYLSQHYESIALEYSEIFKNFAQ